MKFMDPTIFDLRLEIPPLGSRDRLGSLHRQLRAAIVAGRLKPGLRLPSSRELAAALGVSRNLAVAAYDLLLSEGYVATRPGGGTFVAAVCLARSKSGPPADPAAVSRLAPFWRSADPAAPAALVAAPRYDFAVGLPDQGEFSFETWRRLSARALRQLSKMPAGYAEPEGRPALREAIARHVSFARAVACTADDVVVTSGAQQAFDLLARVLVTPAKTMVAVENPGYPPLHRAFAAAGAKLAAVPVDDEGLVVERLPGGAKVVCVTPSHQFPLGMAMSMRRRTALLEFARAHGAVVIEDDYDGEFRYTGRPLDALQTLDRNASVFYVGTFSKSLFPALRLGYVIAPAWARAAVVAAKRQADWHAALPGQDTLAAFIAEGHLARHVRKMRGVYADRREALIQAIEATLARRVRLVPSEGGLHLSLKLPGRQTGAALAARAAEHGIRLSELGRFALSRPAPNGIALGFGMIPVQRIAPAIDKLDSLLR